jgi:hypothetical protein
VIWSTSGSGWRPRGEQRRKGAHLVGSVLAGGDNIDDTARLRAGAAGDLLDDTRAPSTVRCWLRAQKWSNVRELDAVSRELLARLWAAGGGPPDLGGPLTVDLDSSIVPVYGRGKQGAAFGYTKVLPTTRSSRPAHRPGWCCSAGSAAGQLTVRADSAFYNRAVLGTGVKRDVEFSVTERQDKKIRAAIGAIP